MKNTIAKTLFTVMITASVLGQADNPQNGEFARDPCDHVVIDSRPLSQENREKLENSRKEEHAAVQHVRAEGNLELSGLVIPIKTQNGDQVDYYAVAAGTDKTQLGTLMIPIKNQTGLEFEEEDTQLGGLMIPIKTQNLLALASKEHNNTAANYSPFLYHWIDDFPQHNMIQIEDGSQWIFHEVDMERVRNWQYQDTIVISPKGRWGWSSNYAYVMTNKDLGTSIDVNLFLGPVAYGAYTTWVASVDSNSGQIFLMNSQGDKTVWEVSNADLYLLKEWRVNDTLIIGENDGWLWLFSPYDSILINVNMNHNIRARQVSSSPAHRAAI